MNKLIKNIEQWAEDRNLIAGSTPEKQFIKLMEEFGELCSGVSKNKVDVVKDSIGDCFVVMVILARQFNRNDLLDDMGYVYEHPNFNGEPKVRVRWITKEQATTLISNLNLAWMKNVCSFALFTGARMTEILTLTWDKVDFERSIAIVSNDVAKSGKARALPLNKTALGLLQNLKKTRRNEFVFHRGTDKRIGRIDWHDFNQALARSKIENFRFHDLRHTWASWHVQAGTPLYTLKEMGGWETLEMVKKYAHLNADHMLEFANNVTFTTQSDDDFSNENFYNAVNY